MTGLVAAWQRGGMTLPWLLCVGPRQQLARADGLDSQRDRSVSIALVLHVRGQLQD